MFIMHTNTYVQICALNSMFVCVSEYLSVSVLCSKVQGARVHFLSQFDREF